MVHGEQFSREKIFNGIIRSAQKRPVSSADIDEVVNRIEQKVRAQSDSEVESDVIGNLVMEELMDLDEITMFACLCLPLLQGCQRNWKPP